MSNDDFDTTQNPGKPKRSPSAEISEALIKSLKPRAGKGTTKWLADLTQEALEEPQSDPVAGGAAGTRAEPAVQAPDVVTMVDKLFDLFTGYSFEFNRSVAGKGFFVDVERPAFQKAGDARYGARAGAAFSGRLAMRQWSLVLRGETERILGSIIPSDQLFAFNADPDEFPRFFAIELSTSGPMPVWRLNQTDMGLEDLPTLAKQLLASLVRVAKGEIDPGEQFVWTGSLDGSASVRTAQPSSQTGSIPDRPASFYGEEGSSVPASAAASPRDRQHAPTEELLTPQFASAPPPPPNLQSVSTELEQGALDIPKAFGALNAALDRELQILSQAGARAFANQDLAAAELNLKKTAKVKAFREKVLSLVSEWDDLLNEP
ncbi:MAG TPA: hypothetical protein V6D08_09890 [Candidatus Obscuribacterales bacterium]